MDDKLLLALDLAPREIKIYKTVLKSREATPVSLAKATGITRTSCYSIARGLVEKGLLVEDAGRRPRRFLPSSSREIDGMMGAERKRLAAREEVLKELQEALAQSVAEQRYPVPHIRFIEEEKLEAFLYATWPQWRESVLEGDATWWGFQDHTLVDTYREWIDWQWEHSSKNMEVKLLSNQSVIESKMAGKYPRRTIKFWDKASNFVSSTWVAGEYVIMVNTRERPFYLVEIHDATLANDQREVFKNLWPLV